MSSEVKAIATIVIITIAVIAGGLYLTKDGPSKDSGIIINPSILTTVDNPKRTGTSKENRVQIVEFGDFACPACAMLSPNLETVLATRSANIDFTLRLIPIHGDNSYNSATAAFAAGQQDKFFEMGRILFEKQEEWFGKENKRELFIGYAGILKLDIPKFTAAYDSAELKSKVKSILDKDNADAAAMKILSTPTLIIDGDALIGVQSAADLTAIIDSKLGNQKPASTQPESNDGSTLPINIQAKQTP